MAYHSNDPKLDEIVKKLVDHFCPTKVFLFGSRARGNYGPDSDYDIYLVVKDSKKSQLERMDEANFVLWGREVPVDVFIYTEEEFAQARDVPSSISHSVANEGVELTIG
jgi:predicted nucleotidyltransferase